MGFFRTHWALLASETVVDEAAPELTAPEEPPVEPPQETPTAA